MWHTRSSIEQGHGTLRTPSSPRVLSFVRSRERDHRQIFLLRCALTHSAEEGLAYTLVESGGEEQQIRTIEQLVNNPCGVGIEWNGVVAGALQKQREGTPDHGVCAEDGYGCGLAVLPHFG